MSAAKSGNDRVASMPSRISLRSILGYARFVMTALVAGIHVFTVRG